MRGAPLHEKWLVEGADDRVMVRWIKDEGEFRARVDTMASGRDRSRPFWIGATGRPLPTPPRDYGYGTECWRGGEPPTGTILALAALTETRFLGDIRGAWELDRNTLQLKPVPVEGIQCRNTGLGSDWQRF
jgi:hypothetical protein